MKKPIKHSPTENRQRKTDNLPRQFCEVQGCTQYSALKTALREMLSQSIKGTEKEVYNDQSKTNQHVNTVNTDETETEKADDKPMSLLRRYLEKSH